MHHGRRSSARVHRRRRVRGFSRARPRYARRGQAGRLRRARPRRAHDSGRRAARDPRGHDGGRRADRVRSRSRRSSQRDREAALRRLALACAAASLPACAGAPHVEDASLQAELETLVTAAAPHEIAVACRDLATGAEWLVSPDESFHAASTMKIAVLIELWRQAEAGEIALDREVRLENSFASIVDGSPFALDPADDSDSELYTRIGTEVPLRELARRMIVRSSNLATNTLIALVGPARVQSTIESLGTTHMRVLRGVEDGKAYQAGLSNSVTARDLMLLLAALAEGRALSAAGTREAIEILAGQELSTMIPAGLPPGTRVAHKTGDITGIRHDAAIVFPQDGSPYVLVILTRGYDDHADADRAGATIARAVHSHLTGAP